MAVPCASRLLAALLTLLQAGARGVVVAQAGEAAQARLSVDLAVDWLKQHASHRQTLPSEGFLQRNAQFALRARSEIPVAKTVPQDLFLKWVLPYRHLDEPVDEWRPSFFHVLAPYAARASTLREAVEAVVPRVWDRLRASPEVIQTPSSTPVVFKSNCTPGIMAPISETLLQGHASCTGCSILVADGLRSVGVPARIVGTPIWNVPSGGNHNWVEVWTGAGTDGWQFFDAVPAEKVELDKTWFVPSQTGLAEKGTIHGIYAPVWDESSAPAQYALTWREPPVMVGAEDRTDYYKKFGGSQ